MLGRIVWDPRIVGDAIGTRPVFNWLLYGYGVPAIAFWLGGYLLRRHADDVPARMVDAAAILFTVLLIVLAGSALRFGRRSLSRAAACWPRPVYEISLLLGVLIGLERLAGQELQRGP